MCNPEIHPACKIPFEENAEVNSKKLTGGFLPINATRIIMGTFPPSEYTKNDNFFYYPSPRNHFWNRIDNIFNNDSNDKKLKRTKKSNESLSSNNKRKKDFAVENGLAFMDCFSKISRKYPQSSKDRDIIPLETIFDNHLLFDYLTVNKKVRYLLCTYKLAFNKILEKLKDSKIPFEEKTEEKSANKKKIVFKFKDREIIVILLYPATRSKEKSIIKDEQYKYYLFQY